MKTISYIVLAIVLGHYTVDDALAKGEGSVLCNMLASSLSNPWKFDQTIREQSNHFDKSMIEFIQVHINKLTSQAKQREAVCEPYKNKSMGYDLCMGNNPARKLATWLGSVSKVVKGTKWEKTEFGGGQLRVWNSCANPAFCEQLRSAAAMESRGECPLWFKGAKS